MPPILQPGQNSGVSPGLLPGGIKDLAQFLPAEARLGLQATGLADTGLPDLGAILDAPKNFVRPVTGPAALGIRRTLDQVPSPTQSPTTGNPLFDTALRIGNALPAGISQAQQEYHQPGGDLSGQQAYQQATGDLPFVPRLAADVASDPLSYVGAGIPGKLGVRAANLARTLGADAVTAARVARTFEYLNQADQAVAHAPWQAVSTGGKGVLHALGSVPVGGALTVVSPTGAESGARTLGEWAGSLSRQSQFKSVVRQLERLSDHLKAAGRSYEIDKATMDEFKSAPLPGTTPEKRAEIDRRFLDFRNRVTSLKDPGRVAWGVQLADAADAINRSAWDRAVQVELHAPPVAGPMGRPVRSPVTAAYEDAYQTILGAITAANRALDHPPSSVLNWNTGSPQLVTGLARDTFRKVSAVTSKAAQDMAALGPLSSPAEHSAIVQRRNNAIQAIYDSARPGFSNLLGSLDPIAEMSTPAMQEVSRGVSEIKSFWTNRAVKQTYTRVKSGPIGGPYTNRMVPSLQEIRPGQHIAAADLPSGLGDVLTSHYGDLQKAVGSLQADRNTIEDALRDAWKLKMGAQPMPPALSAPSQLPATDRYAAVINPVVTAMGYGEVHDPIELLNVFRDVFTGQASRVKQLKNVITRWDGPDLFNADPYELGLSKVAREKASQYGIGKSKLNDAVSTAINLWKESVLLSGTYAVTNLMGAVLTNAIAGVGPEQTFRHLIQNADAITRGGIVETSTLRSTLNALGRPGVGRMSSSGILSEAGAVSKFLGHGQTASQRLGPFATAGLGAAIGAGAGALQPDVTDRNQAVLHGVVAGAVGGAALPYVSKFLLNHIVRGVEDVVRQDAYNFGIIKGVNARIPALLQDVEATMRVPLSRVQTTGRSISSYGLRTPRRIIVSTPVPQTTIDNAVTRIQGLLDQQGGLISPDHVERVLIESGIGPQSARGVSRRWADAIEEASQEGHALVARTQVDYEILNNAEAFVKNAAPFSTWPIKLTPFFAKHLLEHPYVLLPLIKFNQLSGQMQREQGLTQRFEGSAPLGFGDAFFSALLGRPVTTFYNPLRGLVPFADTSRTAERGMSGLASGNPISGALDLLSAGGIGLNPALELGLRTLDPEAPTKGLLRQAEPLRGVEAFAGVNAGRGFDLNAGFTQLESLVRGALHGGEPPPDLREQAIMRRVDELALQQTGQATDAKTPEVAPYVIAKSQKAGPIWDQASRDVAKERGASSLTGFFLQSAQPQAFLSPEEARIRAEQATHKQEDETSGLAQLRSVINDFQDQGKGNDPAPPELKQAIVNFATDKVENHDDFIFITRMARVGTFNALEKILSRVAPPPEGAAAGYSSGGSPAQAALQRQLALYQNPAALLEMGGASPDQAAQAARVWDEFSSAPEWAKQKLLSDRGFDGSLLHTVMSARDAYQTSHPTLAQYLQYQGSNDWNGNTQSFLQELTRR